ncbi:hypothetical protein NFI95_09085 [Acetobacteraceae bacterium KSS8]|uniref:Glycosyltransferase RgtA/B/C/D-like domain-containing protein n=1 Tax=Endosaccharibacter trunci TaxID=2812733 RepID=A0ABT1W6V3_9PROT|nr:hypothetical protein [Acetobacteraceae bacterium KSS8]
MTDRRQDKTMFDVVLIAGVLLLLALLAGPVLTIPLHIPINYNEGWNAGFDTRAVFAGKGPLYPGPDTFVFNNYPPLGFLLVGAAGRFLFGGDMILAGRVIALLSLLWSAIMLACCIRRLGGKGRAAWAGALLLLLITATFFRGYVAMDDPQWLAHAAMLTGLAVLLGVDLGQERLQAGRIVLACALVLAGGFIKHNLVALPIATTLWLCWRRPHAGLVWIGTAIAGLVLGAALIEISYGPAAFTDILHHRRVFRVHLLTHAINRLAPLLPGLILMALFLRRRTSGPGAVLVALFAVIALVTGTLQRMGEGVYYNAHFEAMIATCLGVGLVLNSLSLAAPLTGRRHLSPALALGLTLTPIFGAMPWHLPIAWDAMQDRYAEQRAWAPVIADLAAAPGAVGCHYLSLCYWAGKPFETDLFNLSQSVMAGGPIKPFHTFVARHGFSLFEDQPSSFLHQDVIRKLGHDPVMDSFRGQYRVVGHGPDSTVLLAPVGGSIGSIAVR